MHLPNGWTLQLREDGITLKDCAGIGWHYQPHQEAGTESQFIYRFLRDVFQNHFPPEQDDASPQPATRRHTT